MSFTDNPEAGRAFKYAGWLFVVGAIYLALLAISTIKEYRYIGGNYPSANVITVSGEGEVFAVPDIAEFSFSVVSEATTVKEAQDEAATKMNAIIAFLKESDIEEKDIRTTSYSANPRYEYDNNPRPLPAYDASAGGSAGVAMPDSISYSYPYPGNQVLVGYEVRQSISVKVRAADEAGEILDGVGALGATDMYGPTFTIDDESKLQGEAREKAIEDARQKAKELADDLDVRLVRIVSFSENAGGWYPYARVEMSAQAYDKAESAPVPELPLGENTITSMVTITYEIR
ncbi:MAG: SIMPL domain-containing protein [Patescibacteria group bacterium]